MRDFINRMKKQPTISFEDTAVAFSYKPDSALRRARLIFSLVSHPWISALATRSVKFALKKGLPVEEVIKKTAFDHFCGGESIEKSEKAIHQLGVRNVGTILDYSVEGEKTEAGFDHTMKEIIRTIEKAWKSTTIPFSVFKITGLASTELLEKINKKEILSPSEQLAWEKVRLRVNTICHKAFSCQIAVLIDAEETWIQQPIDNLACEMMMKYNRERVIVFNTYQLYRTDAFANLQAALQHATSKNYLLGAKIVRGAYMEKERERALRLGYESPIQPTKESCDQAFNTALEFCVANVQHMSMVCGSHNEQSNYYLTSLMKLHGLNNHDERVWFAQLYGMSDNITFNLARNGYLVAKYVPYGPVRSVMPYLFRRAAENTSVAGQSNRELTLIKKELRRRRKAKINGA